MATVLAIEALVLGFLATLLGIVGGYAMLYWMQTSLIEDNSPEMAIPLHICWPEVISLLLASIAVLALAQASTANKLGRLYIPSALQVLE